ncbi:HlyD family secretion protein [Undibacterium macrobrachii]|uniref:Secretion protein n=1 Tax=Undibacterium macrobrachii TaxID=1119058 RepID=A0ABQ2XAR1_9BURK|nr:HlyD family efflux transporter periplasmic adaptor subunit [Undibacterium macrobrachii]GGX08152.1 secretion protein [Undibacterium macrobrachii]
MSNKINQAPPSDAVRPLFRQQAIAHLSTKQYGTVILAKSFSHQFFTVLFVAIGIAIISFFAFFSTTRKAQTSGVLLPNSGVIKVVAIQNGVVIDKRVKEGQQVKAGEVLYVLRSERQSQGGGAVIANQALNVATVDAQKTISAILQKRRDSFGAELKQSSAQGQQKLAALQQRLADIRSEVQRAEAQIVLQQQRVTLSEQNLKRFKDLQATNFISAAQLQDRQAELIDQQQRLADLQRVKASNQRELNSTEAEFNDVKIVTTREQVALQRSAAGVEQDLLENETRREFVVTAAQEGIVTAMTAELGQTVVANQALASILPEGSVLEAEIYAPSRAIGFVKPGMQVLLRYQAYPYQKFGQYAATVREVASTSLRPEELALPGAANGGNGEPVYRIRLTLAKQDVLAYGKALPLKSGMLVDASILLEQRRLYEWVLEPLFSISGRM